MSSLASFESQCFWNSLYERYCKIPTHEQNRFDDFFSEMLIEKTLEDFSIGMFVGKQLNLINKFIYYSNTCFQYQCNFRKINVFNRDHHNYDVNSLFQAFFRRAITDKNKYACPKENNCEITAQKRGNCSACRLQKCFDLGMSKSG